MQALNLAKLEGLDFNRSDFDWSFIFYGSPGERARVNAPRLRRSARRCHGGPLSGLNQNLQLWSLVLRVGSAALAVSRCFARPSRRPFWS